MANSCKCQPCNCTPSCGCASSEAGCRCGPNCACSKGEGKPSADGR
jgi:hypothetical protein